jgi:hypothetical protein
LNDTLSGFDYAKSLADRKKLMLGSRRRNAPRPGGASGEEQMPSPQPIPPDPNAYQSEDIYSLLSELASSSWDSIYMNASRPAPTTVAPRPMVHGARHPRHRPTSPVDLSLQVTPAPTSRPPIPAKRPIVWRRTLLRMARGFATVGQSVILVGIVHLLGKV